MPHGGLGLALRLVQDDELAELVQTLDEGNRPVQGLLRDDEPRVGVDAGCAVVAFGERRASKCSRDATLRLRCPSQSRHFPNVAEYVPAHIDHHGLAELVEAAKQVKAPVASDDPGQDAVVGGFDEVVDQLCCGGTGQLLDQTPSFGHSIRAT